MEGRLSQQNMRSMKAEQLKLLKKELRKVPVGDMKITLKNTTFRPQGHKLLPPTFQLKAKNVKTLKNALKGKFQTLGTENSTNTSPLLQSLYHFINSGTGKATSSESEINGLELKTHNNLGNNLFKINYEGNPLPTSYEKLKKAGKTIGQGVMRSPKLVMTPIGKLGSGVKSKTWKSGKWMGNKLKKPYRITTGYLNKMQQRKLQRQKNKIQRSLEFFPAPDRIEPPEYGPQNEARRYHPPRYDRTNESIRSIFTLDLPRYSVTPHPDDIGNFTDDFINI